MSKTKPLAGKTITLPVFVRAEIDKYDDPRAVDGFSLRASSFGTPMDDEFVVAKTEVTFTVAADFDPVAPMVASLAAEKAKLTAEFTARVADINRRLSELQAIDYTPEAA